MTTKARRLAFRNLDAVDANTDDGHGDVFELSVAATGIGYALLDLADAIRDSARRARSGAS